MHLGIGHGIWQRVEARNIETAARADRLGLPEYYAMEAYVVRPGATTPTHA